MSAPTPTPAQVSPDARESDQTPVAIPQTEPDDQLTAEMLIEEVSIDGMCGVY